MRHTFQLSLIFTVDKSKEITKSLTNMEASSNDGRYSTSFIEKTQKLEVLRLKF